jgi:CDGSH-type Zn-finger protein
MPEEEKPTIEPTRNGPNVVKNLKHFKNSKGEDLKPGQIIVLCRCGGSNNKPYCDNTHLKNGFDDKKMPDRVPDKLEDYEGNDITIHDNRGVCSHRSNCTDNAPKVFRMEKESWIDPDAQLAEETAQVIRTCPSGALSYSRDGILHKDWNHEQGMIISKDGPHDVQGYIELKDPDGNTPESQEHYTLCRCGHSKNKPFCSGQHWFVDFKDPKN